MPQTHARFHASGWWSLTPAGRDRVRADFATVASHQLRTPISIMRWALDTVLSERAGRLTIKQREYLDRAYQQNVFLARIVGDLLRISRIEEGAVAPVASTFRLSALVRDAVRQAQPLAQAYNCTLTVREPRRLPALTSDAIKLREVVGALLDNAIQYGRREGRVVITLAGRGRNVVLEIKDRGIGIPARQQKNIFTKFFRAENAVRSQTEGLGVQLYIARHYLQAIGGAITFRSAYRQGTTFTVTVPRTPPVAGRGQASALIPLRVASDELIRLAPHLGDGLVFLDTAFRILSLNDGARQLLNLTPDAVGRYLADALDAPELLRALRRQPTGEESLVMKVRISGDDQPLPLRAWLLPLRQQDVITGWVLLLRESGDHHRADIAAAERIRHEREFVSITIHELNGPLSINRWSLEMLRRQAIGKLNAEQSRLVDQLYRNNERQLVLVRDLLNLAKLQQGRFSINPQPLPLPALVRDVLEGFRSAAAAKRLRLRWNGASRLPAVRADAGRLAQVLTNLVSNAVKYTPPGGRVTVSARRQSGRALRELAARAAVTLSHAEAPRGYVVFTVRDTGIGIPAHQVRKLFTVFFRSQEVLKSTIAGTGLGLYIAKAIVELHQGDIWCERLAGRGSAFRFSLPVA